MGHHLPAVRNKRHECRIGVDAVGCHPTFVQADHRAKVTARGMARDVDPFRIAAVRGDVLHHPRRRCRRIVDTVGRFNVRRKPVTRSHHGKSFVFQPLRYRAATAREPSPMVPDHRRKPGFPGRPADVEAAHRVDLPVASGSAVGNAAFRPANTVLGHSLGAARGQHENQNQKSFHRGEVYPGAKDR